MRVLGLLFILGGLWFCFTIILFPFGAIGVGLGALLYIAGWHSPSNKLEHATRVALGVAIGCSLALAFGAFLFRATGGKPTPRRTPAALSHQAPAASSSSNAHSTAAHKPAR